MPGFRQRLFIQPIFVYSSHRLYCEIMRVYFGKSVSRIQGLVKIGSGYKDSYSAYVDYYDKDGIVRTVVRNCVVDGYLY